jgi:hypothetical protein
MMPGHPQGTSNAAIWRAKPRSSKRSSRVGTGGLVRCAVLLMLLAFPVSMASAQILIRVMDQDLGTPLEGAKISVTGIAATFVTDKDGKTEIDPPSGKRVVVRVDYPGYTSVKKELEAGQKTLDFSLELVSSLEGSGVVISGAKPQVSDAQAGISEVVTSQQINQQTMGINEDAFSAVKNLPGVGYTGSFDAKPSINGGDPNETVATLDGAYVLNPYQWQGAYTIFNPDIVDSIKLSNGIIASPYGQVMSGLLDVSSKTPTDRQTHMSLDFSTTGIDAAVEQPLGDNAGLLIAEKTMWLEVPLWLFGQGSLFSTSPYMYDTDAKFYWNPSPTVKWTLNAHYDSDGVASNFGSSVFGLTDIQTLFSSNLKMLLNDNLLWTVMASGNTFYDELYFQGEDRDNSALNNSYYDRETEYRYQFKNGFDWTLSDTQVVSFGVDELFETWETRDKSDLWKKEIDGSYTESRVDVTDKGKNTVETGVYVNDNVALIPDTLKAEAGLRIDHAFVYGGGELLMTYPAFNPRVLLTYTTLKDWGLCQSVDFFGGTGLYSQFPADNQYMDTHYGVKSLDLGPTRAWFNELGLEAHGHEGESLTFEGFTKSYFNRFYTATDGSGDTVLKYDGTGYVYGIDFGAKKSTRLWDLSLSYTFTVAELYNPGGSGLSSSDWRNPLGTWYAPSYNRYNTVYASFLYKPSDGFSVLLDGDAASGEPQETGGRSAWNYPINIKLDWHGFHSGSKTRWEFYVACQDIFSELYYRRSTGSASFGTGTPIPSVGYKLSF